MYQWNVRQHCQRLNPRSGLTITEVLVSIGVIGTLMAMLLPAVQQSRAAASRLSCSNNLRQLGLGAHQYHEIYNFLPMMERPLVQLLPMVGEQAIYQKSDEYIHAGRFPVPTIYTCPADPYSGAHGASYLLNDGVHYDGVLKSVWPNGDYPLRLSEITDGLSNTAMFAEQMISGHSIFKPNFAEAAQSEPRRFLWWLPKRSWPYSLDDFVNRCSNPDNRIIPDPPLIFGDSRLVSYPYDHRLTPNAIGCVNGPPEDFGGVAAPASSLHAGGANVLLADGSVRFVSDSIAQKTWWSIGTRAGGESVPEF